jgi:hypothetical protein
MLVGAAKSGTTSLYHYLGESDKIVFSKEKEPHFFSFYNNPPKFKSPETLPTVVSNLDQYNLFFSKAKKEQLLGEASQSYLYMNSTVISNMKEIYGEKYRDVKIIIVLRNPIERAWSQYWHFKKNFNEPEEFLDTISEETRTKRQKENWNIFYNYIDFGKYTNQVKAYQKNFKHVKVFLYEDLKENPSILMNELCQFLEIDAITINEARRYNPSGRPKNNLFGNLWKINTKLKILKPIKKLLPYTLRKRLSNQIMERALEIQKLDLETRGKLKEIYREEINNLYTLLKREEIKDWLN